MPVIICLLRAVNLGGRNRVDMAGLRKLFQSLGVHNPRTYVQSGNIVFASDERNVRALAARIESAIERKFGFRSEVAIRTVPEWRDAVSGNPFAQESATSPNKVSVTFLSTVPSEAARKELLNLQTDGEKIYCRDRELYIYFPNGMGRSKLGPKLDRILKVSGTARNWNTVLKLLEMAEKLEAAG